MDDLIQDHYEQCSRHHHCEEKLTELQQETKELSKRTGKLTWAVAMGTAFFMAAGLVLAVIVGQVNSVKADATMAQEKHEIVVNQQQGRMEQQIEGVEEELREVKEELAGMRVYLKGTSEDIRELKELLLRHYRYDKEEG